jgi:hypothetical protein
MVRRVRNPYRDSLDRPAQRASIAIRAVERLREASRSGKGVAFNATEVRALDWSVIRVDSGGLDDDNWRDDAAPPERIPD